MERQVQLDLEVDERRREQRPRRDGLPDIDFADAANHDTDDSRNCGHSRDTER